MATYPALVFAPEPLRSFTAKSPNQFNTPTHIAIPTPHRAPILPLPSHGKRVRTDQSGDGRWIVAIASVGDVDRQQGANA